MGFIQGGHIVAKAIRAEGIDCVFTLCGGHVQMIYDGCVSEGIRVVDTRHEQSAGHAADGWARTTGKPGVAIVTAGPGVTDAVTAVANAQRAQVPMILIGGQGARNLSQFGGQDRGSLQDMNHVELMRPICKWAVSVPETKRLGEYVQSAFRVATTEYRGRCSWRCRWICCSWAVMRARSFPTRGIVPKRRCRPIPRILIRRPIGLPGLSGRCWWWEVSGVGPAGARRSRIYWKWQRCPRL